MLCSFPFFFQICLLQYQYLKRKENKQIGQNEGSRSKKAKLILPLSEWPLACGPYKVMRTKIISIYDMGVFKPNLPVKGHLLLFSNVCLKTEISLLSPGFFLIQGHSWQHYNIKLMCYIFVFSLLSKEMYKFMVFIIALAILEPFHTYTIHII